MRLTPALFVALVLVAGVSPVSAQQAAPNTVIAPSPLGAHPGAVGEARSVRGRVVRGGFSVARPVSSAWVVLHRVGTDRAAPLDSMRTDVAGRYVFAYRTSGDAKALYFVSSTFGGIAYFTPPLKDKAVTGDDAELIVFDTTAAPVPIRVRARHLVVSAPDSTKTRTVVEIFELSNDSSVTRVAVGDSVPVWESVLLDGARDMQAGQADFSPDAIRFADGRVRLFAPFAPGLKQLSYSYVVPSGTKDFSLLVASRADVMEVLIEDPLGRAEGGGVIAAGPTTVNGRSFARFLGQDVRANAVVRVHAPTGGAASDTQVRMLVIVAALGAALLVGLARYMMGRPLGSVEMGGDGDVQSLRARLAALDVSFANLESPTAEQRADHWQKRAHLKKQLTDALAREQGLA